MTSLTLVVRASSSSRLQWDWAPDAFPWAHMGTETSRCCTDDGVSADVPACGPTRLAAGTLSEPPCLLLQHGSSRAAGPVGQGASLHPAGTAVRSGQYKRCAERAGGGWAPSLRRCGAGVGMWMAVCCVLLTFKKGSNAFLALIYWSKNTYLKRGFSCNFSHEECI